MQKGIHAHAAQTSDQIRTGMLAAWPQRGTPRSAMSGLYTQLSPLLPVLCSTDHCRRCGHAFCQPCSSKRYRLPGSEQAVRVCDVSTRRTARQAATAVETTPAEIQRSVSSHTCGCDHSLSIVCLTSCSGLHDDSSRASPARQDRRGEEGGGRRETTCTASTAGGDGSTRCGSCSGICCNCCCSRCSHPRCDGSQQQHTQARLCHRRIRFAQEHR